MKTNQRIEISFDGTPEQAETVMLMISYVVASFGVENEIVSPLVDKSYDQMRKDALKLTKSRIKLEIKRFT
jgi:hypothetical protein